VGAESLKKKAAEAPLKNVSATTDALTRIPIRLHRCMSQASLREPYTRPALRINPRVD